MDSWNRTDVQKMVSEWKTLVGQMFKKWCQNEKPWYELMVSGNKLHPIISAALTEHQTPTLTPRNGTLWVTKESGYSESSHSPIKSKPTFHTLELGCMCPIKVPVHKFQSCFMMCCRVSDLQRIKMKQFCCTSHWRCSHALMLCKLNHQFPFQHLQYSINFI